MVCSNQVIDQYQYLFHEVSLLAQHCGTLKRMDTPLNETTQPVAIWRHVTSPLIE